MYLNNDIMKKQFAFRLLTFFIAGFFLLTACEDDNSTNDVDVTVTADAGADTLVNVNEEIILDGSNSTISSGSLEYSWAFSSKPDGSNALIDNPLSEMASFTPDVAGEYIVILEVNDGNGETDQDEVTITAISDFVEVTEDISSDETWTSGTLYRVMNTISVRSSAELTIEAGTQVEFVEAAGLYISSSGKLTINGTDQSHVLLTGVEKTPGFWKGIGFDSSPTRHVIQHTIIEYGGNTSTHSGLNEAANIAIEDNVLELTNSTIRQSGKWGLYVESGESSLPNFSVNSFAANANGSAYLPAEVTPYLDSASSFDDGDDTMPSEVFVFDGGNLVDGGTISPLDVAYRIVDNTIFGVSSEVTISGGTTMEFGEAAGLYVTSSGKLVVDGQSGNTVLLTGVEKTAGYWRGIGFDSGSSRHVIRYTTIEYGGNASTHSGLDEPGNIALEENVLELQNSNVGNSGKWGVYVESEGSTLPDFSTNVFSDNTEAPMYIPPSLIFAIDEASDFTANPERYVLIWNTSTSRGGTISPLTGDVPYRVQRSALVRYNSEVTIADGVEIEFEEASGIFMYGSSKLVANGTSSDGILFTSAQDTPTKGFWKGVGFDSNALTHELSYLTIEFAGGGDMTNVSGEGNLRMDSSSSLSLTNCNITDSGSYGIWRDTSSSSISETGTNYARNTNGPQNNP